MNDVSYSRQCKQPETLVSSKSLGGWLEESDDDEDEDEDDDDDDVQQTTSGIKSRWHQARPLFAWPHAFTFAIGS